jgi:hypothetical protein
MIRVGRTRNLLRASSSPSEIWPRSAHHHLGQRHLTGRTNRPDKSPHSITCLRLRNSLQMRAASTREGWIPDRFGQPTSRANPFSARPTGRKFPLFSRVVAGGLLTFARRRGAAWAFSGPTFSEPVDCAKSVNRFGPLILQRDFGSLVGRVRDEFRGANGPSPTKAAHDLTSGGIVAARDGRMRWRRPPCVIVERKRCPRP